MTKSLASRFFLLWRPPTFKLRLEFFAGRTIRGDLIKNSRQDDVYDFYARIFAGRIGKVCPRNPSIIVQNMPGASTMTAADCMFIT